MKLRLMTEVDLPAVLDAGEQHIASSNYASMGFARDRAADFMRDIMRNGFAIIVEREGRFAGALFGDVVQPWYSAQRMGIEHVIYVLPEFRGTAAAVMLIRAWTVWCFDSGATQIRPGVSTGCDAAERFYERLGFNRSGSLFVMDKEALK